MKILKEKETPKKISTNILPFFKKAFSNYKDAFKKLAEYDKH